MTNYAAISAHIITATRMVTGDGEHGLHIPDLNDDDRNLVSSCFDEGFVSSAGVKITQFEQHIEKYTGAKHAIAMSTGTAALHIALITAGVKTGDEVLVPALTFVASGNSILHANAIPHFVESHVDGFGIDPLALATHLAETTYQNDQGETVNKATGNVIRALMVVHIFGHIAAIDALKSIAKQFNLRLIEDAAEALGSWANGIHAGLHGNLGVLSFNGNKTITTGGGGCILTNDDDLAVHARHISTTAKVAHPYDYYHDQLGYNYRMPNLNAALGVSQMQRLEQLLAAKIIIRDAYADTFENVEDYKFYQHGGDNISNYWLQAIVLNEDDVNLRNHVLEAAQLDGLFMRPIWRLLSTLPTFAGCPSMQLSTATALANRTINIPSSCYLGWKND